MSEIWRALVVGCGRIGGGFNAGPDDRDVMTHALAYRRHRGFELAACVDPDAGARAEFMRRWGVARGFATLDDALAADRYDIVSVAGPTPTHVDTLSRLADAPPRAVFAEKPLGGDMARVQPVLARFAAAGVPVAVNFQRRWDVEMEALRREIAAGDWGPLRLVVGRYMRGIVNNGGHMVNLVAFLVGETPRALAATNPRFDGVAGDPTVDAQLAFADGTPMHMIGSDGRDYAVFDTTLCFAGGEIAIEDFGFSVRRRRPKAGPAISGVAPLEAGEKTPTRYGEAMLRALDEIRAWRPGMRLASDAANAVETLRVNQALRAMAAGAKEIMA